MLTIGVWDYILKKFKNIRIFRDMEWKDINVSWQIPVAIEGHFMNQSLSISIKYNKIACFKVKLSWTRESFFVFPPYGQGQKYNILNFFPILGVGWSEGVNKF